MPEVDVRTSHTMIQAFGYYEGAAHNGHEIRNIFIATVNLMPDKPYAEQFAQLLSTRKKMDTDKRQQIQAILVIQSFARDELEPVYPANRKKANKIGLQFAKEQYPDCQAVVYTQIDGQSELIHNHIIACNCKVTDHKAINSSAYLVLNARKKTNEVTRRFGVKLSAALSDKSDHDILYGTAADKKSKHERRLEMSGADYIWEKDIKERVAAAMNAATSEQDFYDKQLPAYGLTISHHGKSKAAVSGEYVIYVLTDKSKMPPDDPDQRKKIEVKSYKLGSDYELPHLQEILKTKQAQQQPQPEKVPEKTPLEAVPAAVIEPAKISDEPQQRISTIKSAVEAAKESTAAPVQTAPVSYYDNYAVDVTTAPWHRKRDGKIKFDDKGKIKFDDIAKEITAATEEQQLLTQAQMSFTAEVERNEHDQRRREILREIQDFEFDDTMDEDDQPRISTKI